MKMHFVLKLALFIGHNAIADEDAVDVVIVVIVVVAVVKTHVRTKVLRQDNNRHHDVDLVSVVDVGVGDHVVVALNVEVHLVVVIVVVVKVVGDVGHNGEDVHGCCLVENQ